MRYLKGKPSLMIFERHANLKYKYGSRNFWAKEYYISTVGLNTQVVEEYIRNRKKDMIQDNLSKKEYIDPFKGGGHRVIVRLSVYSHCYLGACEVLGPYRIASKSYVLRSDCYFQYLIFY